MKCYCYDHVRYMTKDEAKNEMLRLRIDKGIKWLQTKRCKACGLWYVCHVSNSKRQRKIERARKFQEGNNNGY